MEDQYQPEPANQLENYFNISFDANARAQLRQIALWARITTLCAFAGYAIILVVAIFGHPDYSMEAEGFSVGGYLRSGKSVWEVAGSILIGGIINYFLYRFSVAAGRGVERMDTLKMNEGFESLRIYFKITGILLIIFLSVVVLAILVAIIAFGAGRPGAS